MSKKCTPLWREAHFEVKMYKTPHVRATFGGSDVEKVHAVVARSTFPHMFAPLLEVRMWKKCTPLWREAHFEVNMFKTFQNTRGLNHFWRFRCRFASLHYNRRHYTTLHSTTLHYTPQHYNYNNATTLHYTPLH